MSQRFHLNACITRFYTLQGIASCLSQPVASISLRQAHYLHLLRLGVIFTLPRSFPDSCYDLASGIGDITSKSMGRWMNHDGYDTEWDRRCDREQKRIALLSTDLVI